MKLGDEEVQDGEAILVNHKLPGRKICGLHSYQLFLLYYLRFWEILQRAFWGYRDQEEPVMILLTFLYSNNILTITTTTTITRFSLGKGIYPSMQPSTHPPIILCYMCLQLSWKSDWVLVNRKRSKSDRMRVPKRWQQIFFYFIRCIVFRTMSGAQ